MKRMTDPAHFVLVIEQERFRLLHCVIRGSKKLERLFAGTAVEARTVVDCEAGEQNAAMQFRTHAMGNVITRSEPVH